MISAPPRLLGAPSLQDSQHERKKSATRRALRHAALTLLAERGYSGFTIQDIADRADVSTRTFFNYFPSKDAAVVGSLGGRNERMSQMLQDHDSEDSPLGALRAVVLSEVERRVEELRELDLSLNVRKRIMRAVRADAHLLAAHVAETASLEADLTRALALRLGVDPYTDPYPGVIVAATTATIRFVFMQNAASVESGELLAAANRAMDILASGFATPDSHSKDHLHAPTKRTPERIHA